MKKHSENIFLYSRSKAQILQLYYSVSDYSVLDRYKISVRQTASSDLSISQGSQTTCYLCKNAVDRATILHA